MLRLPGRPTTYRRRLIALAVTILLGLVFGAVACDDTTSGGVLPTTGILIRVETLTAGKGCGAGPTQLFKYFIVAYGYDGTGDITNRASYNTIVTANTFDCYVDGEFVSLPAFFNNFTYRLEVFAYNGTSYNANAAAISVAQTSANQTPKDPAVLAALRTTTPGPTWTTECTAEQSDQVETLAQCDPLTPGLGGLANSTAPTGTQISLATQSFRLADGRLALCGTTPAPSDAGADAEIDDAGADAADASSDDAGDAQVADAGTAVDAGDAATDAGSADAGTAVFFTTVRVRPRVGGTVTAAPVDIACPTTFTADVSAEPLTYTIDVGLVDSNGVVIGQTACQATTAPGTKSVAACP